MKRIFHDSNAPGESDSTPHSAARRLRVLIVEDDSRTANIDAVISFRAAATSVGAPWLSLYGHQPGTD